MFKQYPNAEASFKDFCGMVSRKKYYAKLKGNKSSLLWINAMAKAGYSTQPEVWKKLILNAIKKYNLDVNYLELYTDSIYPIKCYLLNKGF